MCGLFSDCLWLVSPYYNNSNNVNEVNTDGNINNGNNANNSNGVRPANLLNTMGYEPIWS